MKKKKLFSSPYVWAFTTYFAEGFPYSIIRTVSGVFFRDMKVSLESIGLTPLFGLPWIIKFLWSPQIDNYGSKKRWMVLSQGLIVVMLFLAALFAPLENNVPVIAALFFSGAFIAATNDISIDGYYMEALDEAGQSKFVGYRVMAYRIAWMTGPGIIATVGTTVNWFLAFILAAIIYLIFTIYHLFFLEEAGIKGESFPVMFKRIVRVKTLTILLATISIIIGIRLFFKSEFYSKLTLTFPVLKKFYFSHWIAILLLLSLVFLAIFRKKIKTKLTGNKDSKYGKAFYYFMEREKISVILSFLILLRAGEWAVSVMVAPLIVDLGIKSHYGWISGGVGLPSSIIGAMLGGWMISRFSLKRVIWPFILIQNLTNLVYMSLAIHLNSFIILNTGNSSPEPIGTLNLILTASVHAFDQFAGGLGTAVLMTYLMRICHSDYKATHYAIGSGLMNLSGLFAGVSSGFIAGWLGYSWLFGISFLFSIPAMALIPFLPYLTEKK